MNPAPPALNFKPEETKDPEERKPEPQPKPQAAHEELGEKGEAQLGTDDELSKLL